MPSFLAASISAGVMAEGSGAAARSGAAKVVAASAALDLSTSRLENFMLRMAFALLSTVQGTAFHSLARRERVG